MERDYTSEKKKIIAFLNLWVRRIYTAAFNIYAIYWLYRQIFVRHSTDFEEWLLYAFAVIGMHYFVLDSPGIFLKSKKEGSTVKRSKYA